MACEVILMILDIIIYMKKYFCVFRIQDFSSLLQVWRWNVGLPQYSCGSQWAWYHWKSHRLEDFRLLSLIILTAISVTFNYYWMHKDDIRVFAKVSIHFSTVFLFHLICLHVAVSEQRVTIMIIGDIRIGIIYIIIIM